MGLVHAQERYVSDFGRLAPYRGAFVGESGLVVPSSVTVSRENPFEFLPANGGEQGLVIYDTRAGIFGPRIERVAKERGMWLKYSARMYEHQKKKIFGEYFVAQSVLNEGVPISCGVVEPSEGVTLSENSSTIRCVTPVIVVSGNENKAFLEGALVPVSKTMRIQLVPATEGMQKLVLWEGTNLWVYDLERPLPGP